MRVLSPAQDAWLDIRSIQRLPLHPSGLRHDDAPARGNGTSSSRGAAGSGFRESPQTASVALQRRDRVLEHVDGLQTEAGLHVDLVDPVLDLTAAVRAQ